MPDQQTTLAVQQARNSVLTGTDLPPATVAVLLDYIVDLSEHYMQAEYRVDELLADQREDRIAIAVLQRQCTWAETAFYAAAQELMKGNTNV